MISLNSFNDQPEEAPEPAIPSEELKTFADLTRQEQELVVCTCLRNLLNSNREHMGEAFMLFQVCPTVELKADAISIIWKAQRQLTLAYQATKNHIPKSLARALRSDLVCWKKETIKRFSPLPKVTVPPVTVLKTLIQNMKPIA